MSRYVIAPAAENDLEAILRWTHENFGERARLRYESLLTQAIVDIAEDTERPGSMRRPEIAADARTYHLYYSHTRVAKTTGRVKQQRLVGRFEVRMGYRRAPAGGLNLLQAIVGEFDGNHRLGQRRYFHRLA